MTLLDPTPLASSGTPAQTNIQQQNAAFHTLNSYLQAVGNKCGISDFGAEEIADCVTSLLQLARNYGYDTESIAKIAQLNLQK